MATVYTNTLDDSAANQIKTLCDTAYLQDCKIRIMPGTIGATMTVTDKAVPNMVGVDIGCGTLDEAPMAYKKMEEFERNIKPTAEIIRVI